MKTGFIVALVMLAVAWAVESQWAARLKIEGVVRREQAREVADLERERARLHALRLRPDDRVATRPETVAPAAAPAPGVPQKETLGLHLGRWSPALAWQERGQATPQATLESLLCAAVAGDLGRLRSLLQLEDATRAAGESLLARMADASRGEYKSAEDLIVAFTTKNIPVGEGQLVWLNQSKADAAVACVFLKPAGDERRPPGESSLATPAIVNAAGSQADTAPEGAGDESSSTTYLTMRRGDEGWRIVVPPNAVEKIARELGYGGIPRG